MTEIRSYSGVFVREVNIDERREMIGTRRILVREEAETRVELLSHEPLLGFVEALKTHGPVKITIEWD